MQNPNDITYFAETDFRNQQRRFGIKQDDRTRHVYVIGKTGMGKSTLLRNMAVQDIQSGRGMAFIDPHGSLVEELLDYVPQDRIDDVLYFAPFDLTHPISFNVMEDVGHERRHLVANGLMSAFKKIWVDMWSARMEYILNNTLLALLEYPDSTLLGVNRMLADKTYRKRVVANVSDVAVRSFWEDEFANYSDRYMTEAGAAIQNKIGQFISNPLIRNIVGQSRSSFDVRDLMDNKKILLINLSKGKVGEDNANLLGSMMITKIYLAAMSRSDVSPSELKNLPQFYFYVDEFQSFANESFADILSEARKYHLSLTIAHQYIEQMSDEVRAAVFGNVGTMMTFRVGATDAEYLEREFAPVFTAQDVVNLGFAQIYLRLMIDGVGSKPFSARTLPPLPAPEQSFADQVIVRSRAQYALPRSEVEDQLATWHESHGGLIDDPQVLKRKEKEKSKQQDQINAYQISRKSNISENDLPIPRPGGSQKNTIKPEEGSEAESNQRLQQAIAKTQVYQDDSKNDKSQNDKKAGTKESINDLRSTLADVLKDAGLSVPNYNPSPPDSKPNQSKASDNSTDKSFNRDNQIDKGSVSKKESKQTDNSGSKKNKKHNKLNESKKTARENQVNSSKNLSNSNDSRASKTADKSPNHSSKSDSNQIIKSSEKLGTDDQNDQKKSGIDSSVTRLDKKSNSNFRDFNKQTDTDNVQKTVNQGRSSNFEISENELRELFEV